MDWLSKKPLLVCIPLDQFFASKISTDNIHFGKLPIAVTTADPKYT